MLGLFWLYQLVGNFDLADLALVAGPDGKVEEVS
jgi:hypothetical protein